MSYLSGFLMLLSNFGKLPTDVLGILWDIFYSVECNDFTAFMLSVYFEYKWKTNMIDYHEYLTLTEAKYQTIYRKGKWSASTSDPESRFYVTLPTNNKDGNDTGEDNKERRSRHRNRGRHNGHCGRGGGVRGGCGGRGGYKKSCHNCGQLVHLERKFRLPGGGDYNANTDGRVDGVEDVNEFPAMDPRALRCPPVAPNLVTALF